MNWNEGGRWVGSKGQESGILRGYWSKWNMRARRKVVGYIHMFII